MVVTLKPETTQLQQPSLYLTLKPVFRARSESFKSLAAVLRVVGFSYEFIEALLTHPLEIYGVPNNRCGGDAMTEAH